MITEANTLRGIAAFLSYLDDLGDEGRSAAEFLIAGSIYYGLPTVYYNLLHLHYALGLHFDDIARRCGCPEGGVAVASDRRRQPRPRCRPTASSNSDQGDLFHSQTSDTGMPAPAAGSNSAGKHER